MEIAFLFYDGMTALDAIGPYEILSRLPGAVARVVAKRAGTVTTDAGLRFTVPFTFADVPRPDVLFVPGASDVAPTAGDADTVAWVRAVHATTSWTTSVCTGAFVLGAAGALAGRRATTHWAALEGLRAFGAEPVAERVVEDGKLITAAGVSAGIDMALRFSERVAGRPFAEGMQLMIEYDPAPPFQAGSPKTASPEVVAAVLKRFAGERAPTSP